MVNVEDKTSGEFSNVLEMNIKDSIPGSQWYAMSATFGRSLKAKEFLENNSVECFVPMKYALLEGKDGKKVKKLIPAINNLLFVHTTKERIQTLKVQLGYLHYLTTPVNGRNVPITVPFSQMQSFMRVCKTLDKRLVYLSPEEVHLEKGTPVKIVGGDFDGVEGVLVKISGKRKKQVVVNVQRIVLVVIVEFVNDHIIKIIQ